MTTYLVIHTPIEANEQDVKPPTDMAAALKCREALKVVGVDADVAKLLAESRAAVACARRQPPGLCAWVWN